MGSSIDLYDSYSTASTESSEGMTKRIRRRSMLAPRGMEYLTIERRVILWEHVQFCDGRLSFAEGDGPGLESFRMRFF